MDPADAAIDAIFPHDLTLHYYKYLPVRYENLRATKFGCGHNFWQSFTPPQIFVAQHRDIPF
jgi:hypothetical protein